MKSLPAESKSSSAPVTEKPVINPVPPTPIKPAKSANQKKRVVAHTTPNKSKKSKSIGTSYDPSIQAASEALREILKKGQAQHPNVVNHHNEEELRKLRQYPIPPDSPQLPKKLPPLPAFKPMPEVPEEPVNPGPTALGGNPYVPSEQNRGPQQFQNNPEPEPTQQLLTQTRPIQQYQTQEYPGQQYQSQQYRQPTIPTKKPVVQLSQTLVPNTPAPFQLANTMQRIPFELPDSSKLVSYEDYQRVKDATTNPLVLNVPLDTNDGQNRWLLGSGIHAAPYFDIQKSVQYELRPAVRTLRRRLTTQ